MKLIYYFGLVILLFGAIGVTRYTSPYTYLPPSIIRQFYLAPPGSSFDSIFNNTIALMNKKRNKHKKQSVIDFLLADDDDDDDDDDSDGF